MDNENFERASRTLTRVLHELDTIIVGQDKLKRRLIGALVADGHILIEGVPGLAKTLAIKALASTVSGNFRRIQFTPDLLPADIIGTEVYKPQLSTFEVRQGPVFTNFLLADEINRAPAKVQSALLEAMQERQVTIGELSFKLPSPFLVMATQNPIEQEGTYALPEAQVDRFLMKVRLTYPSIEEEKKILQMASGKQFQMLTANPVATIDDIKHAQSLAQSVYVDDRIKSYIVSIVAATRAPQNHGLPKLKPLIELGASPRASISLLLAARAEALIAGEHYVVPQMVKDIAPDILRHRVVCSFEAEAENYTSDSIIETILGGIEVP